MPAPLASHIARRSHSWRGAAGVLGLAAVGLLSACNPLSQPASIAGTSHANATVTYTGPAPAWLQVGVTGADGYGVKLRAGVPGVPPRTCADPVTGAATPCVVIADYLASAYHFPAKGHNADFWPTVQIRSGEWASILVDCSYATAAVTCPATTKIVARTVDDNGALIGDLAVGTP